MDKNLLCINYEYPPIGGGGGVVSQGLAEALVKMGYHIDVVTSGQKNLPAYEERNGVWIHRVRCRRRFSHYVTLAEMLTLILPAYFKALELIRKCDYQLNHTHFIVPSGIVSYLLWKKTGLPYIITTHGSDVPGYNPDRFKIAHKFIRPVWKRIISNSKGITTPSFFLQQLIGHHTDTPVAVIPNGYDLPEYTEGAKKNRILVVTRMFERKGIQYFLKAVTGLKTDWEILIAGDGPYLSVLKKMGQNLPMVRFLGFVRGKELIDLYKSAKIFVFPSIKENFPVVLLEAMAAGCAIVTSEACGCVEVVGNAALKTKCGSVAEISNALNFLMNNEIEITRLSCAARERAARFTWSNLACQFDELANDCVCKNSTSAIHEF